MIDDAALIAEVRSVGARLRLPDAPDTDRLVGMIPRVVARRRTVRRGLVIATVVGCLVLVGVPPVRRAVADTLGLGGVRIRLGSLGEVRQGAVLGDLGRLVSVADAEAALAAPLPRLPGAQDPLVLLRSDAAVPVVTMWWLPSPTYPASDGGGGGLVLMLFRGSVEWPVIEKVVGDDASLVAVSVRDRRGIWVEGDAHAVGFLDPDGNVWEDTIRLSANTLLWEEGGITYRLEGSGGLEVMLGIAESLR